MFKIQEGLSPEFLPTAQTHFSAGFDIRSTEDITIYPGTTVAVSTGVFIDEYMLKLTAAVYCVRFGLGIRLNHKRHFMESHYVALQIRSGLAFKGLMLANGTGIIDMDYRDEIRALIHFPAGQDKAPFEIKKGDRIGQLLVVPHSGRFLSDDFRSSNVRVGGFGSTGDK